MRDLQDEMLARFVVDSHVKHHPNAVNSEENDDEDTEEVRVDHNFSSTRIN